MENCFRFLINVDQCLNMSSFDIFFYKLESQHKFHLSNAQLFGNGDCENLRSAISEIRLYLDKYPYHVGDYQIIIAMRSTFSSRADRWESTMLYRLLQIDHALQSFQIFINSREQIEKALNLVMLYDADFSTKLPDLDPYMSSDRLEDDCRLLLQTLDICCDNNILDPNLEKKVELYSSDPNHDPILCPLLVSFAQKQKIRVIDTQEDSSFEEETTGCVFLAQFVDHVKEQLVNFQVFETQIDRNNRRQNILELLRLVEFINMSTELPETVDHTQGILSLSQRCKNNWTAVQGDKTLEMKYADMLHKYQHSLTLAATDLERFQLEDSSMQPLPKAEFPGENAIDIAGNTFSGSDSNSDSYALHTAVTNLLKKPLFLQAVQSEWPGVYEQIKKALEKMDHSLKSFAEELSRQYASELEKRKKEDITRADVHYIINDATEKAIADTTYTREQLLEELRSPQMTPSLNFQDQLNMENALEQAKTSISFYLQCINQVNAANFFGLLLGCVLMIVAHYTILQPYVLVQIDSLPWYLLYLVCMAVLMLPCWVLPRQHFRGKIRRCLTDLQDAMNFYIEGYFKKAEQFKTYINLLNRLDAVTRHLRLLKKASGVGHKLAQGYLWHKVQIQDHLTKLQFFQGLIDLSSKNNDDDSRPDLPEIDGERVRDVADSPIYWPQS